MTITGITGVVRGRRRNDPCLFEHSAPIHRRRSCGPSPAWVQSWLLESSSKSAMIRHDSPARVGLRAFAGTAPVTRASGRSCYVKARKVRNKRLGDACHLWAFATLTRSTGARAHYDKRRATGDHPNAALRILPNRRLGRLWWCLQHDELWDDHAAWPDDPVLAQPVAAWRLTRVGCLCVDVGRFRLRRAR